MNAELKWRVKKDQHGRVHNFCLIGTVRVAVVGWNGDIFKSKLNSSDNSRDYTGFVDLPYLKEPRVFAATEELCKQAVEYKVNTWLKAAGLYGKNQA